MYYTEDANQLTIENFYMPFAGKLNPNNRWVRLSKLMPWERIKEIYLRSMSQETGYPALPARIAFGAIYIKEAEKVLPEHSQIQALDCEEAEEGHWRTAIIH